MATATASNYSADSGEDILIGLNFSSALSLLAASLSVGDMTELTGVSGLNTLDGSGFYPNESAANDIAHDWSIRSVWSAALQKGFFIGAGAGFLGDAGVHSITLEYDAASNDLSSVRDPFSGVSLGHGYSSFVLKDNIIYKMPFSANAIVLAWDGLNGVEVASGISDVPSNIGGSSAYNSVHGLEYMPTLGVSGSLIHVNSSQGRINKYDFDTATWTNIDSGLVINAGAAFVHYNENSDIIVFGGVNAGTPIYTMDSSETITLTGNLPANVFNQGCFIAAPNDNTSLLFSEDGNLYPLDTTNGVWGSSSSIPVLSGADIGNSIAMVIPEHNCILFERYASGGNSTVYLYRYS